MSRIAATFAALKAANRKEKPSEFRRYGSARKLYNFSVDHADAY